MAAAGSKVTVIEMLPRNRARLLDGQVGRTLERILRKQGLDIRLNTRVTAAAIAAKKVQVTLKKDGKKRPSL